VVSIVVAVYKFSQTRQMAMKRGATEGEATVLAMSGPIGAAAAYVAPGAPQSSEARITEVRALQAKGLISAEQAETRVAEILKGI
jgi:hypothetical protein